MGRAARSRSSTCPHADRFDLSDADNVSGRAECAGKSLLLVAYRQRKTPISDTALRPLRQRISVHTHVDLEEKDSQWRLWEEATHCNTGRVLDAQTCCQAGHVPAI